MLHRNYYTDIDYKKMGIVHQGTAATFTTYITDFYPEYQAPKNKPIVILCPGGGYEHHSPREAEPVALKLNSLGYNVIVLRYSVAPDNFPCQLYELAYTVKFARDNAANWDSDPDKIIAAGFSAGGHVAASLGTMWNQPFMTEFCNTILNTSIESIKPNMLMLGYSVLTADKYAHRQSFVRLLGDRYDELIDRMSLENAVSASTPMTFLWHTFSDATVPVENSLLFANALKENNIKFELHIFANGSHGIGLGTKETDTKDGRKYQPECACWIDMFDTFVKNNL